MGAQRSWSTVDRLLLLTLGVVLMLSVPAPLLSAPADRSFERSPSPGPIIDIWVGDGLADTRPVVAYNQPHDEYLVVWVHSNPPRIMARRVRADGALLTWFAVSEGGLGTLEGHVDPDVAYSPEQDEYLVVWQRVFYSPPSTAAIHARRVKWDGSAMSATLPITVDGSYASPAVAYNPQDQEYLVAYSRLAAPSITDVTVQRIGAGDGALLTWAIVASGPAGTDRFSPDLAYNSAREEILVVYALSSSTTAGIRGKVAPADLLGLSTGLEIYIDVDPGLDHWRPRAVAGPDEYLVLWGEEVPGVDEGVVCGRRLDGGGSPMGAAGGFVLHRMDTILPGLANAIDLVYRPGYGYLGVWESFPGAAEEFVFARSVRAEADEPWSEVFVVEDLRGFPSIACDPERDCLVAFAEKRFPLDTSDEIRGRLLYLPIFEDGFESGNVGGWSAAEP